VTETETETASMRTQIIDIAVDALRKQGYPQLSLDSIRSDPDHRAAFVALLGDCRPLPVILKIIEDAQAGRL
jgi:hypothetical protein